MKLSRICRSIPDLDLQAPAGTDPDVRHLALDSRRIRSGSIFLAVRGDRQDGLDHLEDALARGAVAVVSDRPAPAGMEVPWLRVREVRETLGKLCAVLHARLLASMQLHGVTGTKGKTTTTRLLGAILTAAGLPCATIGTLGAHDHRGRGGEVGNTTPDLARLVELLEEFHSEGHRAVAMEASSQAAVQARLRPVPFSTLAFLNLSPEHGELHPTLDDYRAAKARLFRDAAEANPGVTVVVPLGDPDGNAMVEAAGAGVRVIRFGEDPGAEVHGRILSAGLGHLQVELGFGGRKREIGLGFGGRFNLGNLLAAASQAHAVGVELEAVQAGLEGLPPPPGRFQVLEHAGVHAMIDYAHSANSLEALLRSCRELVGEGRLLLVFGCGGEKDPGKRPRMGASAVRYADLVWVTNDNPRREDPEKIASDILAGIPVGSRTPVTVELDRRRAIRGALAAAVPGDLVVIAGKGHERTQTLGSRVVPFDDLEEVRLAWQEAGSGERGSP